MSGIILSHLGNSIWVYVGVIVSMLVTALLEEAFDRLSKVI